MNRRQLHRANQIMARGRAPQAQRFKLLFKDPHAMKLLTFAGYDQTTDPRAIQGIALSLLLSAHFSKDNLLGDDPVNAKIASRLKKALFGCTLVENEGEDNEVRRLNPAGAALVLHESEFDMLAAAWKRQRARMPAAMADEVVFTQDLLDQAESLTPAEIEARFPKPAATA